MAEHLLHPGVLRSRFHYGEGGRPQFGPEEIWPEPWSMIAAMAVATERLRFCTARPHPAAPPIPSPSPRRAATASVLSGGRVVLGAAAGWMEEEYRALGIDFRTRGRRLDECIDVLRLLWSGEMVEHHGEFYDFDPLVSKPAPRDRIPLWIGGASPAALRRAARVGDGWLSGGEPADALVGHLRRIRELRVEAGRDGQPFEAMTLHPVGVLHNFDEVAQLAEVGITSIVHVPFKFGLGADRSTLAEKRRYLERFAEDVIARFH